MDKASALYKFKALLKHAAESGEDLHVEMQHQLKVLHDLGVDDGEINNLIHDRHSRDAISPASAALAVASIREAAGLPMTGSRRSLYREPRSKTREELAAEYLRARGRDLRTAAPVPPPQSPAAIVSRPAPSRAIGSNPAPAPLLVPYGVDPDADIVHARDAVPGVDYCCPSCGAALVLHAGAVRIRHFAHKGNTACDGESLAHITAKLLLAKVIREHSTQTAPIRMQCVCEQCRRRFERTLPPGSFSSSAVEVPVGGFICDVVAVKDETPVLAVEILQTNAVGSAKAEALALPWMELRAADVLDNPYHWRPLQSRLKPVICPDCKENQLRLEEVARRWQLPLANPPYHAAVAPCWKCEQDIIWYWWPGVPFAETPPPEPVPKSVRRKWSKAYGGQYWMNVCPCCGAAQGDNFVFLADDSPFRGLPLNDTESMREHRRRRNAGVVAQFMRVVRRNV